MHLKRLEIQGFKSFADKLIIEFDKGITAIVGPNGSGKSNVADAIRWVLGEQSARILRGAKMEDVIFAGTESRRPVNYAQVSILFDNISKEMPIDYNEICVTRRTYRSGESEYYINKSRCRLRDIRELFMDTGIGRDGYSIIGQGQIDQILSTKPEERRNIFEEAAGIIKFKTRKEQAEKKLEQERQSLVRINDIIKEIENQLTPLKEQAKVTKKYVELKEKLKIYDINLFIQDYRSINKQIGEIDKNLKNLQIQLGETQKKHLDIKNENVQVASQLKTTEEQINNLNSDINNLNVENKKIEGTINVYEEKIANINREKDRLNEVINESTLKLKDKQDQINKGLEQIRQVNEEYDEQNNKYLLMKSTHISLAQVIANIEKSIDEIKLKTNQNISDITNCKSKLERYKTIKEQGNEQLDKLKQEENEYVCKLEEQNSHFESLNSSKSDLELSINNLKDNMSKYEKDIEEHTYDLQQLMKIYNDNINQANALQSKLKWLKELSQDYEGFNKSVKSVMQLKKHNPVNWGKLYGVVADLIKVPQEFETAIEIALGGTIQYLVTEDDSCAKQAINYLKKNKLGRATFLPLNMLHQRKISQALIDKASNYKGYLGIASRLVKYDIKYSQVLNRLLGNVIVVDNFNNGSTIAKAFGNIFRVVTLDGDIFNIGGSITGGSIYKKSHQFLARTREIEEINDKINSKLKEIKNYKNQTVALTQKVDGLKLQLKKDEDNFKELNKTYNENEQQIKQAGFLINYLNNKIKDTKSEYKKFDNEYIQNDKLFVEQQQILKQLSENKQLIDEEIEDLQSDIIDKRNNKEELNNQLTNIKIMLNNIKQKKKSINNTIDWLNNDIEEIKNNKIISEDKIKISDNELNDINQKIKNCHISSETNKNKIVLLTEQLKEQTDKKLNYENDKVTFEKQINDYTEKLALLNKEVNRFENSKTKFNLQINNLQDRIWEEYEVTYNYSLQYEKNIGSLKTIKQTILDLKSRIKKLGNVNMNAIEEYDNLNERYNFLTTQRNDILQAEQQLNELIEQLTAAMQNQFIEKFKIISNEFNLVFQKLFGGGKGILRLADSENALQSGIEIIAQPPGKKLQNMLLLSGGEKALTAISLLFAIQRMKPAPFCVLDEIEAALDDANVKRFADYLEQMSSRSQFIVITHRKGTMEQAHTLYGITMQEKGVSKSVSVKFEE